MAGPPLLGLDAGLAQDPGTQGDDQPGGLGEGDEVERGHHAALGMLPPHQGLDAEDLPVLRVHDRLVVQHELVLLQGRAKVALEGDALDLAGVDRGVIEDVATLALALGGDQRDVGVAKELAGTALAIHHHHPGAGADRAAEQLGGVGPLDRLDDAARDHFDVAAVTDPGQQHRELVAAQPGDDVGGAQAALDAPRGPAQDLVADPVPDRVVDRLEVVEVDEQQGQIGAGVHVALQLQLEGAPVGHLGEAVDAGQPLDLRVTLGQLGAGSTEVDGHHHQRRGQDRGAGDHQADGCRSPGEGPVGEDGDRPQGNRCQGRRQGHRDRQTKCRRTDQRGPGGVRSGGRLRHRIEHMHYSQHPQ